MIVAAEISSRGGRIQNEDSVRIQTGPERFCAVVADGLGGHGGGQIASSVAADELISGCCGIGKEQLAALFERADRAVKQRQQPGCAMKTTAVLLVAEGGFARWAHVGDSRLYHFENGKIVQRSMDHSVSQLAVLMGEIGPEQIRFHEDRNRVLRALGSESGEPDISGQIRIADGGHAFLLCTDGFWEYVYEAEMEAALRQAATPEAWLGRMEEILKKRAVADHDNYSAIGVYCTGGSA